MPRSYSNYCKYPSTYRVMFKPKAKRNTLVCPVCNCNRLIDTGHGTVSKTFKPGDEGYEDADYYQKCHSCGTEIGIKKL